MKDYIEQRCVEIAEYILNNKATVRSCAKVFGVSKSTIHKDIAERLIKINPILSKEVKQILEYNKRKIQTLRRKSTLVFTLKCFS